MNPDENTPEDGARFQPQMNETPEQSASKLLALSFRLLQLRLLATQASRRVRRSPRQRKLTQKPKRRHRLPLRPLRLSAARAGEPCSSRWSAVSEWQPAEPWYLARICVPLLPPPGQPDFRPCTSKLCWNCSRLGSGFGNRVSRGRDNQRLWAKLFRHRLRRDC